MVTKRTIEKDLYKLFNTFFSGRDFVIDIKCLYLFNDYQPERGDEVITYKYKFHIIIKDKLYIYDGWCYDNNLKQIALGIFSHWLLDNYKIYEGESTAFYKMYTCVGNLEEKREMRILE